MAKEETDRFNRRFAVEEVNNGFLLKISEMGSDKLVGRYVYAKLEDLLISLKAFLTKP
jgi:hypothetical protein